MTSNLNSQAKINSFTAETTKVKILVITNQCSFDVLRFIDLRPRHFKNREYASLLHEIGKSKVFLVLFCRHIYISDGNNIANATLLHSYEFLHIFAHFIGK